MSNEKSKLPDLEELGSMTSKLFNGIKKTVNEIMHDYKEKREAAVVVTPTTPPVETVIVEETVVGIKPEEMPVEPITTPDEPVIEEPIKDK